MPRGPLLKLVPLYLEPELYRRLEEQAREQDREATQQARHILRERLGQHDDGDELAPAGTAR